MNPKAGVSGYNEIRTFEANIDEAHIESQNGTARPVTALYIRWWLMQNIRRLSL
jgi:hypothetical protein